MPRINIHLQKQWMFKIKGSTCPTTMVHIIWEIGYDIWKLDKPLLTVSGQVLTCTSSVEVYSKHC